MHEANDIAKASAELFVEFLMRVYLRAHKDIRGDIRPWKVGLFKPFAEAFHLICIMMRAWLSRTSAKIPGITADSTAVWGLLEVSFCSSDHACESVLTAFELVVLVRQ